MTRLATRVEYSLKGSGLDVLRRARQTLKGRIRRTTDKKRELQIQIKALDETLMTDLADLAELNRAIQLKEIDD